jgi:hypothetical protein
VEVEPLLDIAVGRLKGWKGKFLNHKGRVTLINSVITATAIYYLNIFKPDPCLLKKFNTLRRSFLWAPEEEKASGGKCLVSWKTICAPIMYGALRLRWEWFRWTDKDRPWVGTETACDQSDRGLFAACTTITVGNGETAWFWTDRWLDGQAPQQLAPLYLSLAGRKGSLLSKP